MCIAEIPLILYYAYLPTIFLGFLFSLFIYFQNKSEKLNRLLAAISLVFTFWIFLDFLTWFPVSFEIYYLVQELMISIVAILPLFIYFSHALEGKAIKKFTHILLWFPILPLLILTFSQYSDLIFVVNQEADLNCMVGMGRYYGYVFFLVGFYLVWFFYVMLRAYFASERSSIKRKQIKIIVFATAFLILWVSILMKLVDLLGEEVLLLSPVGMVVFVGFLVYAITRYQLFDTKLLAAQALTIAISLLIASQFFFIRNFTNKVLTGITLALSIVFGVMLIKSIKSDLKKKEELQDLTDKLADAYDKLTQLDRAKSEFVSIASHQLRTPLTAIKGFISLLLDGTYGRITKNTRTVIEKVYLSNERLIHLVEDLLNISRIESGKLAFRFGQNDIIDLVEDIVDTMKMAAKNKNLYLDFKLPSKKISLFVFDKDKIREVLTNLIDNAIKYTKKGGVTVRIKEIEEIIADIHTRKETKRKKYVQVIISDTGVGIAPGEEKYIFEKFQRGKDISKVHTEGVGLGLYVASKILDAHKATIWAESDGLDRGSRFYLQLNKDFEPPKEEEDAA